MIKFYYYLPLCSKCTYYHWRTNWSYFLFIPNSPSESYP